MKIKVSLDIVVEYDERGARAMLAGDPQEFDSFERTVRMVLTELDTKFDSEFEDINVRRVVLPEDPE